MAALAVSLCCTGPLLFVLLGISSFGAAVYFEIVRPLLLIVAVLLLALAYYWTYFRRQSSCADGVACETKPVNRAGRIGLRLATFAVILFSLMPYIATPLAARLNAQKGADEECCVARRPARTAANTAPVAEEVNMARATFTVKGMTRASCETAIKLALE